MQRNRMYKKTKRTHRYSILGSWHLAVCEHTTNREKFFHFNTIVIGCNTNGRCLISVTPTEFINQTDII